VGLGTTRKNTSNPAAITPSVTESRRTNVNTTKPPANATSGQKR
jgi:hypothetical protein